MRRFPLRFGLALAGVTFLSLVVAVTIAIGAESPQYPADKSVAGIQNIMNAVNSDQHGLFATIKQFCDGGGGDADAWKLMRHRANIIAEMGNLLIIKSPPVGGDTPEGMAKWQAHCETYRDLARDLSKALAYKKVDKVQAAITAMANQCEACHKDHKSK